MRATYAEHKGLKEVSLENGVKFRTDNTKTKAKLLKEVAEHVEAEYLEELEVTGVTLRSVERRSNKFLIDMLQNGTDGLHGEMVVHVLESRGVTVTFETVEDNLKPEAPETEDTEEVGPATESLPEQAKEKPPLTETEVVKHVEPSNYIKIAKVRNVKTPERGTPESAGIDFFMPYDWGESDKTLLPGQSILISSGIKVSVPTGFAMIAFNKSGVATKKGLYVGACVVDEDYQGEIKIHLTNVSHKPCIISEGDKIIQFLLVPVSKPSITVVDDKDLFAEKTKRGEGGFGSTGSK